MSWKKIIKDSDNGIIATKLKHISYSLIKIGGREEFIGLHGGKMGFATFLYYYSQYTISKKYSDVAYTFLSDIFDSVNNGFNYDTYSGGLAGIARSCKHLYENSFIEENPDDLFGKLDQYFITHMMSFIKKGKYDYLHGGLGLALYLLDRNTPEVKASLTEFIKVLEEKGKSESDYIKWLSVLDKDKGSEGYNLSLSHGIASIIVILAYLYRKGIKKDRTLRLINRAVNYLLKQKKSLDNFSLVPSWISKEKDG